jgi:maltose-binding protein MalE
MSILKPKPPHWFLVNLFVVCAFVAASCNFREAPELTPIATAKATNTPVTLIPTRVPTATEKPGLSGTVSIWHSWRETEIETLVEVIQEFKKVHAEVEFDVLYVPFEDLRPRFEKAAQQGGGPSLLLGPAEWGPAFYDTGLVTDLTDLIEPVLPPRLNQAAIGAAKYGEALIGLPYSIQGVVLYRNRTIIARSPDTFEDLVSLARDATKGDTVGAVLERSFFYSAAHLEGIGGRLMEIDGSPAFSAEDYHHSLAWIELLRSFEQAGPTDYATDTDLNLFKEGRVGFIVASTWNLADLVETLGANTLSIDPWPFYQDGQLSGYVQSRNLYLNAYVDGDDEEASIEFAQFFLSREVQAMLAEVGFIPAASGVQVKDLLVEKAMVALSTGTTYPVIPRMALYSAPMDGALRAIFNEGIPPADALQRAHDEIREALTNSEAPATP